MNPRLLQRHLRLLTLLLAAAGVLYLFQRYETFGLREEDCSPLLRFAPGDDLLLDRWPRSLRRDDALLFSGPDGELYLGIVRAVREAQGGEGSALWIETDAPDCPGKDSDELGWIAARDVQARVLMAWPW